MLNGKNKTVRVIDRVAGVWERVATRLHFDVEHISRMKKDYHLQAREASHQVMMEWLMGKRRQRKPVTWATLITALGEAELSEVAKDIQDILGDRDMQYMSS